MAAIVGSLALLLGAAPAGAVIRTVNFDDRADGEVIEEQYRASHGVYFKGPGQSDGGFLPVVRANTGQAHSGSNLADLSVCPGSGTECEFYTPGSVAHFDNTARSVSAFVGFIGPDDGTSTTITMSARDADFNELASDSATVSRGAPFNEQLSVSRLTDDIASVVIIGESSSSATIGIDDLAYESGETAPPDFGLGIDGGSTGVPVGSFVDIPITINRLNGSNGDISFSVTGLPAGMNATFTPNPVPGTGRDATLRLGADSDALATPSFSEITITAAPGSGAGTAPRSVKKTVGITENCVRSFIAPYMDVRTTGCMSQFGPDKLEAFNKVVRVNGLELHPLEGRRNLIIDKKNKTITSDGPTTVYSVTVEGVPIYAGPINWDLSGTGNQPKKVIDFFDITESKKLKGVPIQKVVVSFTQAAKAQVDATLKLAFWPFSHFGSISVPVGFVTDNSVGPNFNALGIKVERVPAVAIELKDVDIRWQEGGSWFGGTVAVLRFASPYEFGAAFGIRNGDFNHLSASVGNLNAAIGPGIFLQRIGFGVTRNPLTLQGNVGFSGGPSLAGKKAVTVNGGFKAVLADPWVFEVNGDARVADRFKLGEAFVRYSSTGLFELGGKIDWDLGVGYVNGRVAGFVDGLEAASLEGKVRGCIKVKYLPDPCAGAGFIVSSIGIAACIDLTIVAGGIGYYWGGGFDLFGGSCDLSPWRPVQSSAPANAAAVRRYTLRPGLPSAAFAIEGAGDAPGVTLTGPRGEAISVSRDQPFVRNRNLVAMQGENDVTYVVVRRPSGGAWTLTDDDAVPIRRIRQSVGLPRPSVRARVSGRGRRRVLRWRLKPIAGQRVRFVESGRGVRNAIGTARAARGRLSFRPAQGPGGRRRIVALVEQNGLTRTSLVAGSYRAPAQSRPDRPRRTRIRRRGSSLVVSWRPGEPGFRHAVHLRLSDRRGIVRIVPAGRRSIAFRRVGRYGARATVTGLTHVNGRGAASRASIGPAPSPRPAAGRWRVGDGFDFARKGSFTVTRRGRAVTRLRLTPGAGSIRSCGRAELRVVGNQRIASVVRAGLATAAVGRGARRSPDGVRTVPVRVSRRGRRSRGTMKLVFDGRRRVTGQLVIGRRCQVVFRARR